MTPEERAEHMWDIFCEHMRNCRMGAPAVIAEQIRAAIAEERAGCEKAADDSMGAFAESPFVSPEQPGFWAADVRQVILNIKVAIRARGEI